MTKKPAKKCARQPDYHAKNSWYASILPKNQRFSEKRKAESTSTSTHTEAQIYFPAFLKKKEDI